jgi:hypothetical protein
MISILHQRISVFSQKRGMLLYSYREINHCVFNRVFKYRMEKSRLLGFRLLKVTHEIHSSIGLAYGMKLRDSIRRQVCWPLRWSLAAGWCWRRPFGIGRRKLVARWWQGICRAWLGPHGLLVARRLARRDGIDWHIKLRVQWGIFWFAWDIWQLIEACVSHPSNRTFSF